MCGIVAYFGGAGNTLTRVLTAMSAIIYRAPDSTGIGIYGDDAESLRARKSLGSVVQLIDALLRDPLYPNPVEDLISLWAPVSREVPPHEHQRRLLDLEGLSQDVYKSLLQGKRNYLSFDELIDMQASSPVRLTPGWPGRPEPLPNFYVRSEEDLKRVIRDLNAHHDLSLVAIQSLMRKGLSETLSKGQEEGTELDPADILSAFNELFEMLISEEGISKYTRLDYGWSQRYPYAEKLLWHYLSNTPIQIPSDYDRDGIRCLFRLLDASLLCQLPHKPDLHKRIQQILRNLWPEANRITPMDWRTLYQVEKGTNVYGLAAASVLFHLQMEELLPDLLKRVQEEGLKAESIVPGHTDPLSLQYFSLPILSQGRWALQSPVTLQNAHPFFDVSRQRISVLNGQFNPEVETELRDFLQQVAGYSFQSENSSEYFPLLWGYFFELLSGEKKRSEAIRTQIDVGLEKYSIGSQAIDYQIYRRVKEKSPVELDELAFIDAVRRTICEGGRMAVAGMSLQSPLRLYVASHNRPVFIVRRVQADDFMVVSDINAAMGLFPQSLIRDKTLALRKLKKRRMEALETLRATGATKDAAKACRNQYQQEEEKLLEDFRVLIFPMEGEEIFARVSTGFEDGKLTRAVTISDFEGNPLPAIEAFSHVLNPLQVGKDVYGSFYETHLHEIPERLEDILRFYVSEEDGLPSFDLREPFLGRRFGKGLAGLKRIVLIGMGSSYNVGLMAKNFIHELLPAIDVVVLRPVEIEDIAKTIVQERDLVILLSWSGTTADMVQIANDLLAYNVVMLGVTEKRFSDLGLIVQKSGGVISVLSGEEVTVSALKSTMCMLFCLNLLSVWLASQRGNKKKALHAMGTLQQVPEGIRQTLEDETIEGFSKTLASKNAQSYACFAIDALHSTGTGREIVLKLEETSWTAIGKPEDYRDLVIEALKTEPDRKLVMVNATHKARLREALSVMKSLYLAGVPFTAVSYANGKQAEIEDYSQGQCLWLAKVDDSLQPFIDLAFYYMFAFHYGLAQGRSAEDFPRNRAKSVTAGTSLRKQTLKPAAEFFYLEQRERLAVSVPFEEESLFQTSPWERDAFFDWEKSHYREIRRLARVIHEEDPLSTLVKSTPESLERLSSAIFKTISGDGEIIFLPLDRVAEAASRNVTSQWGRLLGCPMRVSFPGKTLASFPKEALRVVVASRNSELAVLPRLLRGTPSLCLWFGPEIPEERAKIFENSIGYFLIQENFALSESDILYAGLCLLLINAWKERDPTKGGTVERHFRKSALVIQNVLNDVSLKQSLLETMEANRGYKTAYFLGPPMGTGLAWVHRFDQVGYLTMERYFFGESIHGPLVTVDPRVENKFVHITQRNQMASLYGEEQVLDWERRYLGGETTDVFVGQSTRTLTNAAGLPFFAEGQWYFPVLKNHYNATQDNLIIVDASTNRYFGQALDELATYGCRYARMIVISQEAFRSPPEKKALYSYPISHLLLLPALEGRGGNIPISMLLLPFAMNLLGMGMAAAVAETREIPFGSGQK